MDIVLSAKNINKSFSTIRNEKLHILKNISLAIESNKITAIMGASGTGKSTLLHILSGLDKPDTGEVLIDNQNLLLLNDKDLSAFRNKNIGFVFQFHHLLPEFTAEENIAIAKMIEGIKLEEAKKLVKPLIDFVGMQERLHHKPAELSGGEQQRIAIARALINKPKIIFADEPTGNLDSQNSNSIHELFINLKNNFNTTFLIVTHNPELVKLADRVLEMKDGQIFEK